jgi:hypothetical protein
MAKIMADNFVIVKLDVQEQPDKKALENAGGEAWMTKWHGEGLPFLVILDSKGQMLVNSNMDGKDHMNTGYPAKPEEIAHFMRMLHHAPTLTDVQYAKIDTWLREHAPKG